MHMCVCARVRTSQFHSVDYSHADLTCVHLTKSKLTHMPAQACMCATLPSSDALASPLDTDVSLVELLEWARLHVPNWQIGRYISIYCLARN